MDRQMNGEMNGQRDRYMCVQMDRHAGEWTYERQTDRQTHEQTDEKTDRQIDVRTNGQTSRQMVEFLQ